MSESNFRLKNKKIHITYPDNLDTKKLYEFLNSKFPIEKYSIVNEIGETGHKHTHCLVLFVNEISTRNPRIFDYNGIHPQIKKISDLEHWDNTVNYHTKQNTPYTNIEKKPAKPAKSSKVEIDPNMPCPGCPEYKIRKKKACETCSQKYWENKEQENIPMGASDYWAKYSSVSEAINDKCKTNIKNIASIATIMKMKPVQYIPEPQVKFYKYQKDLFELITTGIIDPRAIIWIKSDGNHGKTKLLIHLATYYNVFVSTHCDPYHIATTLIERLQEGNPVKTVIINLARSEHTNNDLYIGLEQLKDGFMTSKKFKGKPIVFEVPHVIVFSNELPITDKLTSDKWDIREIVESETDIFLQTEDDTIYDYVFKPQPNPKREEAFKRYCKIKKALEKQGYQIPGEKLFYSQPDPIRTPERAEKEDNQQNNDFGTIFSDF